MPRQITIVPGQQVRGMVRDGKRPEEIYVKFTRQNLLEIFRDKATELRFKKWLSMVLNAFEIPSIDKKDII